MKYQVFAAVIPLTLFLSACTSVEPVYKDIGSRDAPCIPGGPDRVAQQFYDFHLRNPSQGVPAGPLLARYRPYLSTRLYAELQHTTREHPTNPWLRGDIFSSNAASATQATVSDSSTIPNTDARNIPLRVTLTHRGDPQTSWQDEILMAREGTCWTVNDVRYLGPSPHINGGTLRQQLK